VHYAVELGLIALDYTLTATSRLGKEGQDERRGWIGKRGKQGDARKGWLKRDGTRSQAVARIADFILPSNCG